MKRILFFLILVAVTAFFIFAQYWGLVKAPIDAMMGDVYRILFIHVPFAWNALLFLTFSLLLSIAYLVTKKPGYDLASASTVEVGLLFTGVTLCLGSIWGKPTWGVWWTWDPRLTTTALLFILYLGYLLIRRLIDDGQKRAKLCAILAVFIYLNVPIVYFSVKWWRTLHQVQSSPQTMSPEMVIALRLNAFAILFIGLCFVFIRKKIAEAKAEQEKEEGS